MLSITSPRTRVALAFTAGLIVSLAVAAATQLLPGPLIWVVGPFVGSMLTGYLLGPEYIPYLGPACGAGAGLGVVALSVRGALIAASPTARAVSAMREEYGTAIARFPTHLVVTTAVALEIPVVMLAVGLGYLGGLIGCRMLERKSAVSDRG